MRCSGLPSVCRGHKWTTYLRVAGVTLLTLGFCVLFWWLSSSGYFFIFLDWVKRIGYWGNLLFVGAFTLDGLPFMLFGYTPLGLAAGFIYGQYGPVWGIINATVTVSLGTVTGSILGFWSCRKLFKEWFQEKVRQNPTLQAFMSVMESHGFKLVLIMRMAPIPFGVQNGLFSISNISGMSFAMATLIGLFPEILMLVYMGTTMRDLSEIASGDFKFGIRQKIMLSIEIAMTVILCVLLFFLSRQAMQKVKQKQLEASINTDPEDVTALSLADEASDNETARTEDADGDRTPHQNGAVNSDDDMELGDNSFALTPIHTSIAGGGAVVPSIRKKRHEDLLEKAKEPTQNGDIELVDGNAEERWNPFEESHPQEQPHWAKQKEIVA